MFVPANNEKFLESCVKRDADVLLLDIEYSVPPVDKQKARDNIKQFVQRPDLNGRFDTRFFQNVPYHLKGQLMRGHTVRCKIMSGIDKYLIAGIDMHILPRNVFKIYIIYILYIRVL